MFSSIIWVIVYGIIEGITEWLPVSSTGHLIIFENLFNPDSAVFTTEFLEFFRVVVQLGAILAIVVTYFSRLNPFNSKLTIRGKKRVFNNWKKIIIGCIPAGIFGLLVNDLFDRLFYNWQVVASTLIIFGIIFIVVEIFNKNKRPKYEVMEDISYRSAFIIGLAQVLALFPGTSRSGVTIIAGLMLGASRVAAADFTFCMAIPIMAGASGLKALKYIFVDGQSFSLQQVIVIVLGMAIAYVASVITIKFLLKYLQKDDFKPFGIYRIALGLILVALGAFVPSIFA